MQHVVIMVNPLSGNREGYCTDASVDEIKLHIDEVFSAAGYTGFTIDGIPYDPEVIS